MVWVESPSCNSALKCRWQIMTSLEKVKENLRGPTEAGGSLWELQHPTTWLSIRNLTDCPWRDNAEISELGFCHHHCSWGRYLLLQLSKTYPVVKVHYKIHLTGWVNLIKPYGIKYPKRRGTHWCQLGRAQYVYGSGVERVVSSYHFPVSAVATLLENKWMGLHLRKHSEA